MLQIILDTFDRLTLWWCGSFWDAIFYFECLQLVIIPLDLLSVVNALYWALARLTQHLGIIVDDVFDLD